jgi:CDP-glycerol glycerophosphotransferase (TagB/SpsB family)
MNKLGVVITDGVGYRNFILSDFITTATQQFDAVVVFSCLPKSVYATLELKCTIVELDVFQEHFFTWFFRKAKEVSHLQLHAKGNFGIYDNLEASKTKASNPRGFATRLIHQWSKWIHSEKWINRYNHWQQKTFQSHEITKKYAALLQEHHVTHLFFTHQRPPFIAPLIYAAEQLQIKTSSFIFSWDNLASKGRMAGNFDYYLVWSDLMKTELLQFYTAVKAANIEVVGTPQFEPYVLERYASDKELFYAKFDLDARKKTICFSCGDIATSKNDELYIETIAKAILAKKIPEVNLIVRTSPAEDPIRFKSMAEKYPFIKWNFPKWIQSRDNHQEAWSQRIPTVADIVDLRSLLEFSDININMLSTMSLDFMQFDKPVINPVFGNAQNGLYNDQRFLNYEHIVHVEKSGATRIVKNETELIAAIYRYYINPDVDQDNRKKLMQLQVSRPLAGTSKRIVDTLLRWQ